jgi:hypothetical protein
MLCPRRQSYAPLLAELAIVSPIVSSSTRRRYLNLDVEITARSFSPDTDRQ